MDDWEYYITQCYDLVGNDPDNDAPINRANSNF